MAATVFLPGQEITLSPEFDKWTKTAISRKFMSMFYGKVRSGQVYTYEGVTSAWMKDMHGKLLVLTSDGKGRTVIFPAKYVISLEEAYAIDLPVWKVRDVWYERDDHAEELPI